MRTLLISESEVTFTLRAPLMTLPGGPGHVDGRVVYVGDRVLVVLAEVSHTVISVKLRSRRPYIHGIHNMRNHPDARAAA